MGQSANWSDSSSLVTVVVPAFNAEATLARTLDSVLKQTHVQLELVVVDDGSTDGTRAVADAFADADPRVRVLTQENLGLSEARNAGIRLARGAWITFLDSDDWVEPDYLSVPVACADRHEAEVVIFGFFVDAEGPNGHVVHSSVRLPSAQEQSVDAFPAGSVDVSFIGSVGYAWNKLYRRTPPSRGFLFEPALRQIEDIEFQSRVMPSAEKVVLCPRALIHYVQPFDGRSLGRTYSPDLLELRLRGLTCAETLIRRWGLEGDETLWRAMALSSAWAIVRRAWESGGGHCGRVQRTRQVLRRQQVGEIAWAGLTVRGLSKKDRLRGLALGFGHAAAIAGRRSRKGERA